MGKIGAVTTVLAWTLAVAACGGASEVEVRHAPTPHSADSIYVDVVNDYFYDARVYALYEGGHRYTLGIITGHSESPTTAVLWQARPIVFEISFIGAPGLYLSDELMLEPGDAIKLTTPPNIASSAFFRRR